MVLLCEAAPKTTEFFLKENSTKVLLICAVGKDIVFKVYKVTNLVLQC